MISFKHITFMPLLLTLSLSATEGIPQESPQSWFDAGQAVVARNKSYRYAQADIPIAKNIILFIGDGMGVSTVTAARIRPVLL